MPQETNKQNFQKKMQHNEINIGLPHVQEWRALKILAKI